ncbi:alpha/beta fold hydrolase [Cellulomonas soli]
MHEQHVDQAVAHEVGEPHDALAVLRARLRATRWPDAPAGAGWSLGTDVDYLRELVAYWADEFDWPTQEAALWRHPRLRVTVGGLGIHVVHARATHPVGPVLPLVLTHGWPDSSWRYQKVVSLLTDPGAHGGDPADAFDVVVPDVPGFGWSDHPDVPLDSIAVAGLWSELMSTLGYDRFGAAGGDIGSHVTRYLALDHPDRVVAAHRTDAGLPVFTGDPAELTDEERAWFREVAAWGATEGAYGAIHRTKPQTAAFGLTDSPPGWPPGSSRSCGRGATAAGTSSAGSPRTTSSRTSPSTGSPARSARPCGCTTRTPRSPRRSSPAASRSPRGSPCSAATSYARRAPGWSGRRTRCGSPSPSRRALRRVRGARGVRAGAARLLPTVPRLNPSYARGLQSPRRSNSAGPVRRPLRNGSIMSATVIEELPKSTDPSRATNSFPPPRIGCQ